MTYNAIDIAKYIVSYCTPKKHPISNLKLQKILYFAWINYYKKKKEYLFKDPIFAWQFGPVVLETYYEFCSYAGIPISRSYSVSIKEEDSVILNNVIDEYSSYSVSELVNKTHEKGKPWDLTYKNGLGFREEIPFPRIIELEC